MPLVRQGVKRHSSAHVAGLICFVVEASPPAKLTEVHCMPLRLDKRHGVKELLSFLHARLTRELKLRHTIQFNSTDPLV
eukprot:4936722-Amphidinium_carterae.1